MRRHFITWVAILPHATNDGYPGEDSPASPQTHHTENWEPAFAKSFPDKQDVDKAVKRRTWLEQSGSLRGVRCFRFSTRARRPNDLDSTLAFESRRFVVGGTRGDSIWTWPDGATMRVLPEDVGV